MRKIVKKSLIAINQTLLSQLKYLNNTFLVFLKHDLNLKIIIIMLKQREWLN